MIGLSFNGTMILSAKEFPRHGWLGFSQGFVQLAVQVRVTTVMTTMDDTTTDVDTTTFGNENFLAFCI